MARAIVPASSDADSNRLSAAWSPGWMDDVEIDLRGVSGDMENWTSVQFRMSFDTVRCD
jgi:hypothetical protein